MQIACLQTQRLDIWIESKALVGQIRSHLTSLETEFGDKSDVVPPVSACDLISYLVLQTSFIIIGNNSKPINLWRLIISSFVDG